MPRTSKQFTVNSLCTGLRLAVIISLAGFGSVRAGTPPPCVLSPAGLIGWWPAEGNAGDNTGVNHGTLMGNLGFAPGRVGQAFNFTADGQGVVVPASTSLNVGKGPGLTVEGWINPADATSQMPIAEWNDAGNPEAHFWISVSYGGFGGPGSIYASLNGGIAGIFSTGPGIIQAGIWQHVAMTWDQASGSARLYRNGVEVLNANPSGQVPATKSTFYLGTRNDPFGGSSFRGSLDEFSVYNRALTAVELLALYNAGGSGKCSPIQSATNSIVSYNFNSGALPPGATLVGAARIGDDGTGTNCVLHLTDANQCSVGGAFVIPDLAGGTNLDRLHVHWRSRVGGDDGSVCNTTQFGRPGADGYSFNWGTNLATSGAVEEGTGTGISVTVDTFDNGSGEAPGLEIRYKGVRVAFDNLGADQGAAKDFLRKNTFIEADLDVEKDGQVAFIYDTRVLTARLEGWAGIAGGSFVFAARTGGASDNHWIDDVLLEVSEPPITQSAEGAAYTFTTFAGSSLDASADGVGANARFYNPEGVAVDTNGTVYVADQGHHTIRMITRAGVVSTIAGLAGTCGSADGVNTAARFCSPHGIAADAAGNLYVTEFFANTIRKMKPEGTNWAVSTITGRPNVSGSADGTNDAATFSGPSGIAVDRAGNLFVADYGNNVIRMIATVGTNWAVTTIAGQSGTHGSADGPGEVARFFHPEGVGVDQEGSVYVADNGTFTIRKIVKQETNWMVSTIAGSAYSQGADDGSGSAARFGGPTGVAVDRSGNVYIADLWTDTVRKLTRNGMGWVVATLAGSGLGSVDGLGTAARFRDPAGVAVDFDGNVYVADSQNNEIRKVSSAGLVRTLAGSAGAGPGSVDGIADAARFFLPVGVTIDNLGVVSVADSLNNEIRQITSAGVVYTIAGSATESGSRNGIGSDARFYQPQGIAADNAGNVFVSDTLNHTIRKISSAGVVSTAAGLAGSPGSQDGINDVARFNHPLGIAVDSGGNIYVADSGNGAVRKLTPTSTSWAVSTVAHLTACSGIAVAANGSLYVSSDVVLKLRPIGTNWAVSIIARLLNMGAVAVDTSENVYIVDPGGTIQKAAPVGANWVLSTIGGQYGAFGATDGAGNDARFNNPLGIAVDSGGNIYLADSLNHTIRKGLFTSYRGSSPVPYTPPPSNGQIRMTILPAEANGQWRFPWELAWRSSSTTASNLAAGNYPVQFRNIPGWIAIPSSLTVPVSNQVVSITNQHYASLQPMSTNTTAGSLTVNIGPSAPGGVGWRFLGDAGNFLLSGYTTNLLPGTYVIEFAPVNGYSKPPNQSADVFAGLATVRQATYLLPDSDLSGFLLPFPVPTDRISDVTNYPFGFNGQLETDVGYGSGVAVHANVVLTAAHLVFNDQTLSYVSHAFWSYRQEGEIFEPNPTSARAFFLLSGYAAQRTNDLHSGLYGPDQSTPQSRNLDVAALYFQTRVAGGGDGGYLPSDAVPNPWLTGNSLKMLTGYPVDGALFGDASIVPGTMYQTDPQPYRLDLVSDPVAGQQVYKATWFLSYPGNSGGPLYVQFNGYYYPAAVYLGTLYSGAQPIASLVRAIDSNVVNLITMAATNGETGVNHTGGGVVTVVPSQNITASNPGYVQWQLAPSGAVQAGAGWRLHDDPTYSTATNYTRAVFSTNPIVVEFTPIPGWNLPSNQTVMVLPGQITYYSAFYSVTNPVLAANHAIGLGITGTTGTTYRLENRNSLNGGTWVPLSTNTILSNGLLRLLPWPLTNGPVSFYRAVWLP